MEILTGAEKDLLSFFITVKLLSLGDEQKFAHQAK
jgi:hypothetical protein